MATRYEEMIMWGFLFLFFSWFLIFLYRILNQIFSDIIIKINNKKFFKINLSDLVIIIILVFIVGVRTNSGSDYYNYLYNFLNIDKWFHSIIEVFLARYQNGFYVLMYFIKTYSSSSAIFFSFVALVIYSSILFFIRKYSIEPVTSFASWMILGYFLMTTNIMKQSMAMIFLVFSFSNFSKRNYIRFFIFGLLSTWFHISSFVAILLIIFSSFLKPSRSLLVKVSSVTLACLILLKPILYTFTKIVNIRYMSLYVNQFLNSNVNEFKLQLGAIFIFFINFLLIWTLTSRTFLNKMENNHSMMLVVCILSMPFLLLSLRYYIFNRIAFQGLQFMVFLTPYLAKRYKKQMYLSFLVIGFLISILNADNNYYNYSTIFNDTPVSIHDFVRRE